MKFSEAQSSYALRHSRRQRRQQTILRNTNRSLNGYLHGPLFPAEKLVKLYVVDVCAEMAQFEDASRDGDNATITWNIRTVCYEIELKVREIDVLFVAETRDSLDELYK
jgi:hypothetical protein